MVAKLKIDIDTMKEHLADSINRYEAMRTMPVQTDADRTALLGAFRSWDERNQRLLQQSFTPVAWHEPSPKSQYTTLQDIEFLAVVELTAEKAPDLGRLADEKKRRIASLMDSLDLYVDSTVTDRNIMLGAPKLNSADLTLFLIHGRDSGARNTVFTFLSKVIEGSAIVLADQPWRGNTLIEKLESHVPRSTYAVVLATADDEGRLRNDPELSLRARQNVIFELGLAVGLLGRGNVAVLREDGVKLPSDYNGVGYISFDAGGGWKLQLIAELKAAGFPVDANKAV